MKTPTLKWPTSNPISKVPEMSQSTAAEAPTTNNQLLDWVGEIADLTQPDAIHWCDGSAEEYDQLAQALIDAGTFERLSDAKRPNSYLALSDPGDVARVEDRTFICSETRSTPARTTIGATRPRCAAELKRAVQRLHEGPHDVCRSLLDGPAGLADRPHRRAAHRLGLRRDQHAHHDPDGQGRARHARRGRRASFPACTRSGCRSPKGQEDVPWPCNAENKYIVHFPETREIWSYGSGYGGNALLGKKCFALRIASAMARDEGWMAEHMLILKLTSPEGKQVRDRRLPLGLRQDQPGHADPEPGRLEGRDGRRRHRLDEVRRGRPPLRGQSRGRLLRRRPRHRAQDQPERDGHDRAQLDLHQLRHDRRRRHLVGGNDRRAARACDRLARQRVDAGLRQTRGAPQCPLHARRPRSARASPPSGRTRTACRSTPSSSAAGGRPRCRSCTRPSTGSTACSSARRCPRRRPPPRRQRRRTAPRSDGDAALLRLQHGRLLRPLAEAGRARGRGPAEDLLRQLVPQGRRRQVHLARLRREQPRARVDLPPLRRRCRGGGVADRAASRRG